MEIIRVCPLCDCEKFELFIEAKDFLISLEKFSVVKCNECGFLFTNPRPPSHLLGDYYQSEEYISHTDSRFTFIDKVYHQVRKFMLRKKLNFINSGVSSVLKPFKLLDYGCGTGEFLLYAKANNFVVTGVEPSSDARNLAINKGLNVSQYLDTELERDSDLFDVITMWHVLEHIPDPLSIIDKLTQLLAKDGLIVVAVPEYLSFDSRFYKENWAAWDLPRHLNHFNSDTILKVLSRKGFIQIKKHPLFFDSFYVSLLSEKAKKSNSLFGFIRAFFIGLVSNILGYLGITPFSSQVYLFKRASGIL